jgi:hypothetical protein
MSLRQSPQRSFAADREEQTSIKPDNSRATKSTKAKNQNDKADSSATC